VLIEANPKAADYFKRRKIFSTQEIRETKPEGSLIVSLKVGHFGEVRETLKAWLPNVKIQKPRVCGKTTALKCKNGSQGRAASAGMSV
jgi:ABC-type phosphonate transport system ATPase subunit